MNLRNQVNVETNKKPINLAVEQLNNEIMIKQQQMQRHLQTQTLSQSKSEFLNYLKGDINEDEYKRRLSLISNSSSLSNSLLTNEQFSKLIGLEFYDSNNMTDARDSSLEKLIGMSMQNQQRLTEQQQDQKSKSSGLFTKTDSNSSKNDTLNDQEHDSFHDIFSDSTGKEEDDDEDDEDEDSQALIMALLNNRNFKQTQNNKLNPIDLKRQFIQEQLEIVRRQKDQLEQQESRAFSSSACSNTNHLPPPVKMNKFVNEFSMHELSTIKEVDTPKSERNLKLTNSNMPSRQQFNVIVYI